MTYLLPAVVLLAAIALAVLGYFYLRFLRTPARVWKGRLLSARAGLEEQLRAARRTLAGIDTETTAVRQEYLDRHLRGLSIDSLLGYPGIGPGTIGKLKDAGINSVDAALRVRLEDLPGIGPARGTDLIKALKKVREDAVSRFDAGASPEAAAYAQEVARRKAASKHRRTEAEAAVRTAEAGLAHLAERARLAEGISFRSYLLGQAIPGLTDAVMAESFDAPAPPPELPVAQLDVPPAPAPAPPAAPPPVPVAVAPAVPKPPPPATPLDRLKAAAGFGFAVAKSDGRIAASERKQIRAFLERRYARDPALLAGLDALMQETENDLPTLGDALWAVRQTIPPGEWPDLYQFAAAVADAAGVRNTREIECLARVAEEFGIGVTPAAPPVAAPAPTPLATSPSDAEARAALEIAADVPLSVDLIRRQYRLLTDRFDPAKFSGHGAEFTRMAAEKRARVEQAARHLLAEYNEPLDVPAAAPPSDPRHNPDLDAVFGV